MINLSIKKQKFRSFGFSARSNFISPAVISLVPILCLKRFIYEKEVGFVTKMSLGQSGMLLPFSYF